MRKFSGLFAATIVAFPLFATVTGAEELDNYVYNADGTYYKVGQGNINTNGGGFVQASGGYLRTSTAAGMTWEIRGSYGTKIGKQTHFQADVDLISPGFFNIGGHLSTNLQKDFVVGGFAQYYGGTFFVGTETALHKDNFTLWTKGEYGIAIGTLTSSVGGRLYLNDNFRLDLQASYLTLAGLGFGGGVWSARTKVNYRFEKMKNTTLFAGYESSQAFNRITAGLRYSFGSQSIKDEERNNVRWQ